MSEKEINRRRKWGLPGKTPVLLLLLLLLGAGAFVAWIARRADHELRADLLQQARLAAQVVNVENLRSLSGTEEDLNSPAYLQLKEHLAAIRAANPNYRFVYFVGRKADKSVFFFVDSEPATSADYSPPGQLYPEASKNLHRVFDAQTGIIEGPYTDRWGTWVSALMPVSDLATDSSGVVTREVAQAMVRSATDFYRKNGREAFLREVNDPLGQFHKGSLYVFVSDLSMTVQAHPVKPELVGRNLLGEKDIPGGKYFGKEIQDVALSLKKGWVDYEYKNPVSNRIEPKTTYVERADDLIVCAGAYRGSGELLSVMGIDINARAWKWMIASKMALPVGMMLFFLIGVGVIYAATRRVRASPEPVLRRLMVPLAAMMILLTGSSAFVLWRQNRQELFLEAETRSSEVAAALHTTLREQAFGLTMTARLMANDPVVQKALREGAWESLLSSWQPVFKQMLQASQLTHFYFLDAQRVCLLRVHKPEKRGDRIDRFTALEAERTGTTAAGIELGPLGTFTLRVVQPVFEGAKLVGYVELGKEIEDVFRSMQTHSGNEFVAVIRKQYLKRKSWEEGMRLLGRQADWDRLSESVVIFQSQERLFEAVKPWAEGLSGVHVHGGVGPEVSYGGKDWRTSVVPLQDVSGAEVGDLLVLHDVTEENADFSRLLGLAGTVVAVLLSLLMGIIYVLLRRTDAGIVAQQGTLRKSEESYRNQFARNSAPMLLIDPLEGGILDANGAAVAFYGYSREKLLTLRITDINTLPAAEVKKAMAAAVERKTGHFEFQHRLADGSLRDVETLASAVEFGGRTILHSIILDITSRKQAEKALEESEKRFLDVMYASKDAILLIRENNFVDANDAAARLLKYPSRIECLKKHPSELSPPTQPDGRASGEKANEMIQTAIEKGYNQFEWIHRKADGADFPVLVSLTPITLHGKPVLYCVWKDLTLEKRNELIVREQAVKLATSLEESLKSREILSSMLEDNNEMSARFERTARRLDLILSSVGEGIFGLDAEGNHTFVNAQALKLLGYAEEELIGKPSHSIYHHSHSDGSPYPESECPVLQALRACQPRRGEDYYWRKDGTGFYIEYSAVPLLQDGKTSGVVISFLDITERKRSAELLDVRIRLVQALDKLPLREFLQLSLDEIERVSGSLVSFYHFVANDQKTISLQAWSTRTKEIFCKAKGDGEHYSMDKAGVWVDAVRERTPVIHNDYKSLPHRKGIPEGHADVIRELVLPIFREDKVVAILGVGNKPQDYDQDDIQRLTYLADIVWELTSKKLAEEALRQGEDRMRSITDSAHDAILMMDPQGKISFWNPAAERILGYSAPEALGKNLHQLLAPPRFHEAQAAAFPRFLMTGKGAAVGKTLELAAVRKDGAEISVSLSLSAVKRDDGWHAVGIISDITERKRAEMQILKFQRAIEQSPATVVITDLKGDIEYVNPKFCQLTGYTKEEVIGKNPRVLKSGEIRADVYKQLWETITNGKEWRGEFHNKKKNGELFWESASISPIRNAQGEITHFLAVKEDISDQKNSQALMQTLLEELNKARISAEIASQAKSMFVANMSHEIRTPMNAILGFSEILSKTELDHEQRNYVDTMCSSGRLLLELINDILDFSKLEAAKVTLEEIEFDLEYLCKDAFNIASQKIKHDQVSTYVDLDKDTPVHLKGDPTRIRQILVNLLGNAAKFTEKGEIGLRVCLSSETTSPGEHAIQFTVKDSGIGIPQDKLADIFDRFSQVDMSTTRKYGGTGLGLAICKALVEKMDGRIWVESADRVGSEFKFVIKLKRGTNPADNKILPLEKKNLAGKTVIIVDDNKTAQEITRRYCLEIGLSVVCIASSAAEALEYLKRSSAEGRFPDIVLSDIRMELKDGYQFIEEVNRSFPGSGMKFIAITSDIWAGAAKACEKRGFMGYLPKPVFKADLARVLATVLGDKRDAKTIITKHSAHELAINGMRVLVAEDTKTNQMLIRAILTKWGVEVEFAENGQEALEKLKAGKYDLCLMDLHMPVMGGLDATRILRKEISKDLPVIALTAAVMDEDRLKCMEAGMTDFIAKPINVDLLKEKMVKYGRPV